MPAWPQTYPLHICFCSYVCSCWFRLELLLNFLLPLWMFYKFQKKQQKKKENGKKKTTASSVNALSLSLSPSLTHHHFVLEKFTLKHTKRKQDEKRANMPLLLVSKERENLCKSKCQVLNVNSKHKHKHKSAAAATATTAAAAAVVLNPVQQELI